MRKAIVLGKRVWFFLAPDPEKEKEIAQQILTGECLGGGNNSMDFYLDGDYCRAVVLDVDPAQRELLREKSANVVEIEMAPIDVIYITRLQTERQAQ